MVKDKTKALKRCSKPETTAIIVVRDEEHQRTNLMPLGWKMWTSADPRMIAFSVSLDNYTNELLLREKECVLAWPGKEMLDGLLKCASVSGINTDKLELTGWETQPASFVKAPLLLKASVNLECRIIEELTTGDHTLFVANVVEGYYNENIYPIFTLNEESLFNFVGQGKGYRFATFS